MAIRKTAIAFDVWEVVPMDCRDYSGPDIECFKLVERFHERLEPLAFS